MNVKQFVSLVHVQARMGLKAEASKLILSYFWWILEPLLYVVIFYLVFAYFLERGGPNYLFFLMCGKIPLLWFTKSVSKGSNSLIQNKGLIGLMDAPKTLFPYISVQEGVYRQWAVFWVLLCLAIAYDSYPDSLWWLLLPLVVSEYLFIIACTLLGAWLVSYARDVSKLIGMFMVFMLFASGVFWDINDIPDPWLREALLNYNPMAFYLDSFRAILMRDEVYDMFHLAWLSGLLVVVIAALHVLYHYDSRNIALRVVIR
ncbi:ABC transporter permease [Gilvimarinus xylanilyticus]|uniref:Transport permease protein n=1 Tax=Gilvimarinus xylanilyticus TaxID=2944139 RepID=A0A9X2KUV7_9GAMM|nr:ABC transporter permease [Gilvimarinus xylanilyticus]